MLEAAAELDKFYEGIDPERKDPETNLLFMEVRRHAKERDAQGAAKDLMKLKARLIRRRQELQAESIDQTRTGVGRKSRSSMGS